MTKDLLISDITLMGDRFCVIGLAPVPNGFVSIRPIPHSSYGWNGFVHGRGDVVRFAGHDNSSAPTPPHGEDWQTTQFRCPAADRIKTVSEGALVKSLKRAEVADELRNFFGALPKTTRGGSAYIAPASAARSIAGCAFGSVSLDVFHFNTKIRVAVALSSGESLRSLPLVDSAWRDFIQLAGKKNEALRKPAKRLQEFINSVVVSDANVGAQRFIRLGLSRPFSNVGDTAEPVCWVMVDSIFPQPKREWLAEL